MPDFFNSFLDSLGYKPRTREWDANVGPTSGQDIELPNPNTDNTKLQPVKPRSWLEDVKDPTYGLRKYFHNQQEDKYGPTDSPLPTDALGLFSQDFSPEGANPAHGINPGHASEAAISLVPRELLKKRAIEIGESAKENFKRYPNLRKVVEDMSEKHPYQVGNLSEIIPDRKRNTAAVFWSHDEPWSAETLRGLISDPNKMLQHPDTKVQSVANTLLNTTAEERIKKLSGGKRGGEYGWMPRISIGGAQEANPIAENYKTMRHELSHANDYVYRPGDKGARSEYPSPGYWVSRPEVRARAVERNYGRDMGINDANKTRAIPFDESYDGPPIHLGDGGDEEAIFHELNAARERYGDKIAAELAYGGRHGGMLSKFGTNRVRLTPAGAARKTADTRNIAADTYNHFFGPRTGAIIKPRLQLPEKFDVHGISQGQYPVTDIFKDLF